MIVRRVAVICVRCGLLDERPEQFVDALGSRGWLICRGCELRGWVMRVHHLDHVVDNDSGHRTSEGPRLAGQGPSEGLVPECAREAL